MFILVADHFCAAAVSARRRFKEPSAASFGATVAVICHAVRHLSASPGWQWRRRLMRNLSLCGTRRCLGGILKGLVSTRAEEGGATKGYILNKLDLGKGAVPTCDTSALLHPVKMHQHAGGPLTLRHFRLIATRTLVLRQSSRCKKRRNFIRIIVVVSCHDLSPEGFRFPAAFCRWEKRANLFRRSLLVCQGQTTRKFALHFNQGSRVTCLFTARCAVGT